MKISHKGTPPLKINQGVKKRFPLLISVLKGALPFSKASKRFFPKRPSFVGALCGLVLTGEGNPTAFQWSPFEILGLVAMAKKSGMPRCTAKQLVKLGIVAWQNQRRRASLWHAHLCIPDSVLPTEIAISSGTWVSGKPLLRRTQIG